MEELIVQFSRIINNPILKTGCLIILSFSFAKIADFIFSYLIATSRPAGLETCTLYDFTLISTFPYPNSLERFSNAFLKSFTPFFLDVFLI